MTAHITYHFYFPFHTYLYFSPPPVKILLLTGSFHLSFVFLTQSILQFTTCCLSFFLLVMQRSSISLITSKHTYLYPLPYRPSPRYAEQLAAIPQFAHLGPLFKSSAPVELTEAETEYMVRCIKHTFQNHIVLQVRDVRVWEGVQ